MSKDQITREMLEQAYEDATGLDAQRGQARIDYLQAWIRDHKIENFQLYNDPQKSNRDFRNGIRWYAGAQNGDTIMLGYTNTGSAHRCKNAIFAQSDEIEIFVGE